MSWLPERRRSRHATDFALDTSLGFINREIHHAPVVTPPCHFAEPLPFLIITKADAAIDTERRLLCYAAMTQSSRIEFIGEQLVDAADIATPRRAPCRDARREALAMSDGLNNIYSRFARFRRATLIFCQTLPRRYCAKKTPISRYGERRHLKCQLDLLMLKCRILAF